MNETTITIPDASSVTREGGSLAWTFSEGKICRGKEDNREVAAQGLVGIIKRWSVQEGRRSSDDTRYRHFEVDIETSSGIERIVTSLTSYNNSEEDSISVSGKMFAWAMTQVAEHPEKVYHLTAALQKADKVARGKQPSTYCNLAEVKVVNGRPVSTPIRSQRSEEKIPLWDEWLRFENILRASPLYQERENVSSGPTHLGNLCEMAKEAGQAGPKDSPESWLGPINKVNNSAYKTIAEVPDDVWGEVILALNNAKVDWSVFAPKGSLW